jgi:uncharacterized protein (DUF362 family)
VSEAANVMETLAGLAHPHGGWGYAPGQPAHLEPTCLALLALSSERDRFRSTIDAALRFVEENSLADGSYRLARGRPQALWPTALVLFTRCSLGESEQILARTVARLTSIQGLVVADDPEVADMMDIDLKRIGWPWALNTFSWVEPTSWACLALRRAGKGNEPRVVEGVRLLLDRAFDQGGINYGNRLILGRMTEPIPTPSALMLLAVQGYQHPRIDAAKVYLRKSVFSFRERSSPGDLEHLAWAKLALGAHGEDVSDFDQPIRDAYASSTADGRPLSLVRHALTGLALSADKHNPFRLPEGLRQAGSFDAPSVEAREVDNAMRPGFFARIKAKLRGVVVRGIEAMRAPPAFGGVHIAAVNAYEDDLVAVLKKQFEHYRPYVPLGGKQVVLKPNLVEWHRDKVINTDPRFVSAVIELCRAEGASEVVVAEGPGHWRNVEFLVEESGLGEVLRKHGVRFVDLNHDEPVKVLNLGRTTGLEYLFLTRTITSADVFISLPKLKTHHWAGATLSLKNLFGTLPGICYGWPKNELHWRGIPNSIIDIALTQTPHLAIVDGIIGMEGDGPLNGRARHMGAIVMGIDLVAVDATCCRLMGLPPERLPTLMLGADKRLGRIREADIPQIGEPIAKLAQTFELPPKVEKQLLPEIKSA